MREGEGEVGMEGRRRGRRRGRGEEGERKRRGRRRGMEERRWDKVEGELYPHGDTNLQYDVMSRLTNLLLREVSAVILWE